MGLGTYLIFVHSINSSASVKKLTEGNFFFTINTQRTPDCVLLYTLCYFTHNVSFYTQCVILLTVIVGKSVFASGNRFFEAQLSEF